MEAVSYADLCLLVVGYCLDRVSTGNVVLKTARLVEAVSYADLCSLVVDYCLGRVSSPLLLGIETGRYLRPASGEKGGIFGLSVASGLYPVSLELQGMAARDFAERLLIGDWLYEHF